MSDEDLIECNLCNGTGREKGYENGPGFCTKCLGFKKVTWTENITGKVNIQGYVYAPYLPFTIYPTISTSQTKEQLENYAKILNYKIDETKEFNENEIKEGILKCLKRN